jgi:predicted nucleic acid-binding protein
MQERAKEEIDKRKKLVRIVPLEEFAELVGEIKVMTSLSLADAANIALGEHKNVKVLFKHKHELDDQVTRHADASFRARIVFIDDFPYYLGDK